MRNYKKWLTVVLVVFICGWLSGCSSIHYRAQDKPMINFKSCSNANTEPFHYEETYDFYAWGLVPNPVEVDVTAIAKANGASKGLCDVVIEERFTPLDCILGAVTFGIYCPRTVIIDGKKIK